ncbi:MAG: type II secretion system F family protein, partial [Candidatus Micrarchaeota archaeon]
VSSKAYLNFAIVSALLFSLAAGVVSFNFSDLLYGFLFFLIAFALSFFYLLNLPASLKRKRAEEIERDLPIALRAMHIDLVLQTPFEKALRNAGESGLGDLSKEFRKINSEIEVGGSSVRDALIACSGRVASIHFKRAVSQLVFAYEHGAAGEGLRKTADELIELQKLRSKEFSAKMSFLGLVFITLSTIVPALFGAYAIVGSVFLALTFSPEHILFAFVILFPLVDAFILYYIRSKTPKVLAS